MSLPRVLYRAAQVREFELATIAGGVPGYELMKRAAWGAAGVLRHRWPEARSVAILCGGGNNGGDGLALARVLHEAGLAVTVLASFAPEKLRGEAAEALRDLGPCDLPLHGCGDGLEAALSGADVVVDALLGLGARAPLSTDAARLVQAMNACGRPILALDLPSGLDPDRGVAMPAVGATVTLCFLALKQGLFVGEGPSCTGELHFDSLGLELPPPRASMRRIAPDQLRSFLTPRRRDAHKAEFGRVLVVGGGEGMPGAVRLTAEAALRVGAGLVTVASLPQHAAAIVGQRPELMFRGVQDEAQLAAMLPEFDVVVVGPGLGQQSWGVAMLQAVLTARIPKQKIVVDADALNLLAQESRPTWRDDWVLTPHPGEAARLLGRPTASIQGDRPAALAALLAQRSGVVVLKGAGTLIGAGGETPFVCEHGNPGMAIPGMGDVLAGALAGLLAQRREPFAAAVAAVELHSLAGDRCARNGERGMFALEVATELRAVLRECCP